MKEGSPDNGFWDQVRTVFGAALELPPQEREAWLDEAPARDPAVVEEVRSLLARTEDDLPEEDDPGGERPRARRLNPPSRHPARLGTYRILSLLGEGGMGAVYEAEQNNPHRRVALKVIRVALASGEMRRRFELEGEVLGRLRHPCIAQVYETGTASLAEGVEVPYLSMEHVEGAVPLTKYVVSHELSLADRLELFCLIADGIEHAHQQGIVHRDLKPDNVLVDADGSPKVIDFGLARAVDEGSGLLSMHTRTGQIMGTPKYMSPEQFFGKPGEVDVTSDVYSLGVMLYELITGELPYELSGLGVLDMARVVRDQPARPVSHSGTWVRDDLDTIVGKALEKLPDRRYQSAAALAADVRRYLRHEPVDARPASALYQARLFARRNRALVGSLAAVLVVAVAAAIVSIGYAIDARERADYAERKAYVAGLVGAADAVEEQRFAAARQLLEGIPELQQGWEYRHLASRLDEALASPLPADWDVRRVEQSADGSRLAVFLPGGDELFEDELHGTWTCVETSHWTVVSTLSNGIRRRGHFALSPDGSLALQMAPDQTSVALWDVDAGTPRWEIAMADGEGFRTLAWHPDSGQFVVAGPAHCTLHRASDGAVLAHADRPRARSESPHFGAFTSDGRWFVERRINACTLLDAATLEPVGEAYEPQLPGGILWAEPAPSGPLIALVSVGGAVQFVEASPEGLRMVRDADVTIGYPMAVDWSRDAGRLAVGTVKQQVHVFDSATGQRQLMFPVDADPLWLLLLPESDDLLYGLVDGRHEVKSVGRQRPGVLRDHRSFVYPAVFSPDGALLVTGGWDGLDGHAGGLKLRDAETGAVVFSMEDEGTVVFDAAFTPDGARCVAAVWHLKDGPSFPVLDLVRGGARRVVLPGEHEMPQRVDVHPDGRRVLSTFRFGEALVWDLETEEVLWSTDLQPPEEWRGLDKGAGAFSPDGRLIALGDLAVGIRLVDAESYETVRRWVAHEDELWSLSFSPDGRWLLSAGRDHTLGVWDVATGELVARLAGHAAEVMCAAVSPDGSRIASGGRDAYVRLWDTEHFENVAQLGGHGDYIYSVDWSPDGERLVTTSGDRTVRLWETTSMAQQLAAVDRREQLLPRLEVAVARALGDAQDPEGAWRQLLASPGYGRRERELMRQVRLRFARDGGVPAWYGAPRVSGPLVMDGHLDEADWERAPWTGRFVDIEGEGEPRPAHDTRMRMLWDDEFLYVAARLDEPHVWGTLTEHDSIIYHDNDFEVFLDPEGDGLWYGEVEVNALGTIFDLQLNKAYNQGGVAIIDWSPRSLRAGVAVDGTLNDPSDVDVGWAVEIAIPHDAFAKRAGVPVPPRPGDVWRVNASRVQWRHEVRDGAYRKLPDTPEDNWVWTPQGAVNMHIPRRWGFLEFLPADS